MERISKKTIERLKARDKEAFSEIFLLYKDRVYYFALKYVKNHQDAQDIVQDTFIRCLEKIHLFSGSTQSFNLWFMTIAKNQILNYIRDKRRRNELCILNDELVYSRRSTADLTLEELELEEIRKLIGEHKYFMLIKRYVFGETIKEIAKDQNKSTESIRREIKEAFAIIKKYKGKGN